MRYLRLVILLILGMTLFGCRAEPTQTPVTAPTLEPTAPPAPEAAETPDTPTPASDTSPLPTPATGLSPLPTPMAAPVGDYDPPSAGDPPSDKGAIVGQLIDHITRRPAAGRSHFLGELSPLDLDGEQSHLIVVQPTSSPNTMIDQEGYFIFSDILPGTYAMVIWSPINSWVVSDPETELDILVTVNAGEVTDAGQLAIDLPD